MWMEIDFSKRCLRELTLIVDHFDYSQNCFGNLRFHTFEKLSKSGAFTQFPFFTFVLLQLIFLLLFCYAFSLYPITNRVYLDAAFFLQKLILKV